jgi:hypothetical protein
MEKITLSALGPETDPTNKEYSSSWDGHVREMVGKSGATTKNAKGVLSRQYDTVLRRRMEICCLILRQILGSYVVDNAFLRFYLAIIPVAVSELHPRTPCIPLKKVLFHIC